MFGCRLACDLAACDKDTNSPSESRRRRRRRDLIQERRAEQPEKASASRGGVTEVTVVVFFFFFSSRFVFFFYKYPASGLRLTLGRRKNTRCVLSTTASWCLFFFSKCKSAKLVLAREPEETPAKGIRPHVSGLGVSSWTEMCSHT